MLIELDYPEPVLVELEAAKTLLLIIDMENENAHPKGALYIGSRCGGSSPRFASFGKKYGELAGGSSTRNLCGRPMRSSYGFQKHGPQTRRELGGGADRRTETRRRRAADCEADP